MPLLGVDLPGGRSASWSANIGSNSRNFISPFLTTTCLYWGIDLLVDLPIWALTEEMWNHHSWTLDASTREGRSAGWSANMISNSRNVKSPFLTTTCLYWEDRSAGWSANKGSNGRNVKSPFLTTTCLYWEDRSAGWSANMSSNSRNVKLPYVSTRCLYQGVDLPDDLPNLNTLYISCFASQRSFCFY